MPSKLLCLMVFAFFSAGVAAGQEDWLSTFAKKNAGKFSSELSEAPRLITVRSKPFSGWWKFSEFDQTRGMLRTQTAETVWSEWLYERCQSAGSFVGTSSFGAKVTVKKLRCERLEIQDHDFEGISLRDLEIPMSPQQYRDFKAQGPIYEMDFEIGKGAKQEVASDDVVLDEAKISRPIERRIRVLRVNGEIKVLRIFSPDGKTLLTQISR